MTGLRAWGSEDLDDDERYLGADPERHVTPEARATADQDWARTRAALDGDAGLALYARADLDAEAFADDWEEFDV